MHVADLSTEEAVRDAVEASEPHHIYNLAGSTSVAASWQQPVLTADIVGVGPVRLLRAAWELQERLGREVRFVQASSAEVFGDPSQVPQDENTPHAPVTPYGAAKDMAHQMVAVYRRRGLFATNAILYNHESPRRPPTFVARKITRGVAAVARGERTHLTLGNVDVRRDWGFAQDHVGAMVLLMQAAAPGDFVVATGDAHTVRDFVKEAFAVVGIDDYERHLRIDPALYRPADPSALVGNAGRLLALGWTPSVTFSELVALMVAAELESV
ncbi:GDP-mannose 4,6-dehydratase [Fodinibacter luteus]|uniref:GDP-mannose 4,6-dehydratase n=1 Tax=Fodinibacter luteus TaxID=552064 RepID=A0ABP8KJF6_9MICO